MCQCACQNHFLSCRFAEQGGMISRGLPRTAGLFRQMASKRILCPSITAVPKRTLTTPTQPLNATEVTIERDAFLSPSARTFLI